jgi:hypothetical protein
VVLEQIVALLVDLGPSPVSTPLLPAELEIMAPSWAISNVHVHLISIFSWERSLVLDQT